METLAGISWGRARIRVRLFAAAAFAALLAGGCAPRETSPPPPQAETAAPAAGAESTATAAGTVTDTSTTAPATAATAPPPTTKTPPPPAPKRAKGLMSGAAAPTAPAPSPAGAAPPSRATSEPVAAPAAPAEAPRAEAPPAAAASKVDDPGGPVAAPSKNSAATRVGPEKCKICHKIQFASWAETGHAKRNPPLDCESCHGPGSEYKGLATMKDPEKAKAAGLVLPDAKFCGTCHKRDWTSDMLAKAHAHKARPAE